MKTVIPFGAGVLFAIGLCGSGMTNPEKVQNFLDVTGSWDPSLAFVMAGAIGAHVLFARWAMRAKKPYFADAFAWPAFRRIDVRLLAGAAIFGVGWGLSGYCPGPAILSIVHPSRALYAFLLAMTIATIATRRLLERPRETQAVPEDAAVLSRS